MIILITPAFANEISSQTSQTSQYLNNGFNLNKYLNFNKNNKNYSEKMEKTTPYKQETLKKTITKTKAKVYVKIINKSKKSSSDKTKNKSNIQIVTKSSTNKKTVNQTGNKTNIYNINLLITIIFTSLNLTIYNCLHGIVSKIWRCEDENK